MGKFVFALLWMFIFAAAAYDGYFAWQYRAVLPIWEQNPLASWAVEQFGLVAVLLFKLTSLSFAVVLAIHCRRRRRLLDYPITLIIGSAYLFLTVHYVVGHQQPFEIAGHAPLVQEPAR